MHQASQARPENQELMEIQAMTANLAWTATPFQSQRLKQLQCVPNALLALLDRLALMDPQACKVWMANQERQLLTAIMDGQDHLGSWATGEYQE